MHVDISAINGHYNCIFLFFVYITKTYSGIHMKVEKEFVGLSDVIVALEIFGL